MQAFIDASVAAFAELAERPGSERRLRAVREA
jgi:hypothetical protein